MLFASRVQVKSADKRRINSLPGEAARIQVELGKAFVIGTGKTVRAIQFQENSPRPTGSITPFSVGSYMGTRYTHREAIKNKAGDVIGYQHELNHLHADDEDLFRLAVNDNIVVAQC